MALRNTIYLNDSDLIKVIGNLEKMKDGMTEPKRIRRIKVLATEPMKRAIQGLIHDSGRKRKRGNAEYVSGNLRKSIRVLPMRKRQLVYLGVRVIKDAKDTYGTGNRANGWYGHFVEYGTDKNPLTGKGGQRPQYYFRKGVSMSERQSLRIMEQEIKRTFDSIKLNG